MIIFGSKGRISDIKESEVLKGACPDCGNDLYNGKLCNWFTLYFIPIFPYQTIEHLYRCKNCKASYKESIKDHVLTEGDREELQYMIRKHTAITFVACLGVVALSDGSIDQEEQKIIDYTSQKLQEFQQDMKDILEDLKQTQDKEIAYNLLRGATEYLTKDMITIILHQCLAISLSDGHITQGEKEALQDILLILGLPKNALDDMIK